MKMKNIPEQELKILIAFTEAHLPIPRLAFDFKLSATIITTVLYRHLSHEQVLILNEYNSLP